MLHINALHTMCEGVVEMAKKRKYRPRRQFKFWLYMDKSEENRLIEFIDFSKRTRKFASMIRNGIRLMWSLGEGDTTVLFELFPHIEAQIVSRFTAPPPPDNSNLERKLERIEQLVLEQGRIDKDAPMVAAPPLKQLGAGIGSTLGTGKLMSLPTFDDDDVDTVLVTKSTANNSGQIMANMLKIAF